MGSLVQSQHRRLVEALERDFRLSVWPHWLPSTSGSLEKIQLLGVQAVISLGDQPLRTRVKQLVGDLAKKVPTLARVLH